MVNTFYTGLQLNTRHHGNTKITLRLPLADVGFKCQGKVFKLRFKSIHNLPVNL